MMLLNRSVGATPTIARVVLQQQRVTAAGCMRLLSTATHPPPRTVYLNGSYLPETEAKISVFDRGFQFSDSVYEVTSVLDGKLVDFEGHMERLKRSLRELEYTQCVPNTEEYLEVHRTLTRLNHIQEGVVYVQVTRGVAADRAFTYDDKQLKPTVFMMTQSMELIRNVKAQRGIRVRSILDQRWGRCDIKTTQLLYQALGQMQARSAGVDDAWMVEPSSSENDDDMAVVTEGSSNNAWIVRDGVFVTRPTANDILAGITRATVLRLLDETTGMALEERPFTLQEVYQADEAFCTSSSNFVMPVIEMNGRPIGTGKPGPWTQRLREIYIEESRKAAI